MARAAYILVHAAAAGAFMFYLQSFALGAATGQALAWGIIFALGAAGLAWHQSNR